MPRPDYEKSRFDLAAEVLRMLHRLRPDVVEARSMVGLSARLRKVLQLDSNDTALQAATKMRQRSLEASEPRIEATKPIPSYELPVDVIHPHPEWYGIQPRSNIPSQESPLCDILYRTEVRNNEPTVILMNQQGELLAYAPPGPKGGDWFLEFP
ncbi:hypothetical protein EK21DRAFT_117073 [Setomelanomma holmii]|uniref:Uncharacterized protein n=1 Tax=Setomelanomma holmii TaxID=210430 RepID=A0A9P4H0R5_9PLEO|nr:hypothetical protein EK21DRAFT_117073 [Setomelanomma holmii]